MKTSNLLGILALGGVGYFLLQKNKKTQTPLVNMPNKPASPTFDRDKASREFAKFAFPIIDKRRKDALKSNPLIEKEKLLAIQNLQNIYSNASGVVSGLADTLVKYRASLPIETELSLYKKMLGFLNAITDDSDAEFSFNEMKKMYELGEKAYNPDLETQIRMESISKKYPNARFD